MWSIECTPTAVIAPPGASSGCARQLSAGMNWPVEVVCVRDHRHHLAELAVGEALADLHHRGMEAPVEADRQHDAGLLRRGDDRLGARPVERQRLLAHGCACRRRSRPSPARRAGCAASRARRRRCSCRRECPRSGRRSGMFFSRQKSSALARVRVWAATNWMASVLPCTALTSERPQRPSPMMAARTVMRCALLHLSPLAGEVGPRSGPGEGNSARQAPWVQPR